MSTVSAVSVAQYVALDERIDGAESDGLLARWEFGRALLAEREGKKLPKGRLAEIVEATGKSRAEIKRRVQFAERYPSRGELAHTCANWGSWHDIVAHALPASVEPPPAEPLPELAVGTYRTIVADPPWQYDNKATRGAAEDHYPTLSLAELCALPVSDWAADQAHLYLWTTNGFLRESFDVLTAWGFEYKTTLVWVKPQIGMGNYFRSSTEYVLFGTRGGLKTLDSNQRNWFEAKRGRHSKKPGLFFDLVEIASPGPHLEMFARDRRLSEHSWDFWGNEAQVRYSVWGRVTFVHPGKHGDNDLRVEFNGAAPSFAETLTLVWGLFRAEDRYDESWQEGRAMLKRLVDEIYAAPSWADARRVIERCDTSVEGRRAA